MEKRLFLFALILAGFCLPACTASQTSLPTPSEAQIDIEEQAVYAAMLKSMYGASMYVLMDTTATSPTGVGDTASILDLVVQNVHGVDQITLDSFRARNETAHPVQPDMELGSGYVLLSQGDMSLIFSQNRDGWQFFYEQYPDAPGITTLSRVGFNGTLDQALVYVGTMSHWLAGSGTYLLLKKVNGMWTVDQQVMTWIS